MNRRRRRHGFAIAVVAVVAATTTGCPPPEVPPPAPAPQTDLLTADAALVNPAQSADGNWVAFASKATDLGDGGSSLGHTDVFLLHRGTGDVTRVTAGNESSGSGYADAGVPPADPPSAIAGRTIAISADGRYVAFESYASNLTGGSDTVVNRDVYRWDRITGTTLRVSHGTATSPCIGGAPTAVAQGAFDSYISMSSDGGTIAWWEYCSGNPGGTSIWRAATGTTTSYILGATGTMRPVVSGDGSVVVASEFHGFDGDFGQSVISVDATNGTVLRSTATPNGTQIAGLDDDGSTAVIFDAWSPVSRLELATGARTALTGPGNSPGGSAAEIRLSVSAVSPDLGTVVVLSTQNTGTAGNARNLWLDRVTAPTGGGAATSERLQGGSLVLPDGAPRWQWTGGTPFDPPSTVTDEGDTVVRVQPDSAAPSKLVDQ